MSDWGGAEKERTGCAEKSISSELKTAAHMMTVKIQMPNWATTPVPVLGC